YFFFPMCARSFHTVSWDQQKVLVKQKISRRSYYYKYICLELNKKICFRDDFSKFDSIFNHNEKGECASKFVYLAPKVSNGCMQISENPTMMFD
ncbi:MAG: hypothetical protein ACTSYU_05920, partial [Promethearchaeota archaeon]